MGKRTIFNLILKYNIFIFYLGICVYEQMRLLMFIPLLVSKMDGLEYFITYLDTLRSLELEQMSPDLCSIQIDSQCSLEYLNQIDAL